MKQMFVLLVVSMLVASNIKSVAGNPCPLVFHYEQVGQKMIGVVKIYPQIYSRIRTDRIVLNVELGANRLIPYRPLQLYKPLPDTYADIANRRPILYRVESPIPFRFLVLLEIRVSDNNGFDIQVCKNHGIFNIVSRIGLQCTIFLPTTEYSEEVQGEDYDRDDLIPFDPNVPDPAISNLEIPKVILQRVDDEENPLPKQNPRWKNRLQATNSQCGTYHEDLKYTQLISGGEKIGPGTWPWLVAIFRQGSKASNLEFQCTGTLISNRLVLTAAHCFKSDAKRDPIAADRFVLSFGRHDIRDWTENFLTSKIDEIILHPDYLSKKDSTIFDADVAILVIQNHITFTTTIKPICLWPTSVDRTFSIIGENGTLVGWGQPLENIEENVPRKLVLPVVPNQRCFPSNNTIKTKRVFCAGTKKPGQSPCNGDSGSAFAIWANNKWFLRGVVSAALGDPILNRCELNTYVIFTDIIHYRSWIDSYM